MRFLFRICPVISALAFCIAPVAHSQTVIETSTETRFQIDLKVPDAALKTYLPQGFTSAAATQGPAKDCNLRVVFIDRISIKGPDGKPLGKGSNRLVYLVAPVKDPSGANVQLVIGGLTQDRADVPGPFGNYLLATTHDMTRFTEAGVAGPKVETQDWTFAVKSGEHLELHITYQQGAGTQSKPADVKFYSARNPTYYQISHQEQTLDILRNTTTNPPDRVKQFSLKTSGGSYDKLFDNTVQVLSWDNIPSISRTVSTP